jgi:hypothetical protein
MDAAPAITGAAYLFCAPRDWPKRLAMSERRNQDIQTLFWSQPMELSWPERSH